MKKILITFIAIISFASISKSQTVSVGDTYVNAGIGLGYSYGLFAGVNATPLIWLSGEKGVYHLEGVGAISAGGIVSFKHIGYKSGPYNWSWNDFNVGARGLIHFNEILEVDKVDFFGGISVGLRIYSYPTYSGQTLLDENFVRLFSGGFFGARYELTEKLLGYAELGYDISYLKVGLSLKL